MPVAQAREGRTMKKRYSTVVFDLDGTLLNTLEDLTNAVNAALRGKRLSGAHHAPGAHLCGQRRGHADAPRPARRV